MRRDSSIRRAGNLAAELGAIFGVAPLAAWLELFDGEDVCVGPVATLEEAADEFGCRRTAARLEIGEHTDAWRRELGL